jgi:hypothetical protein
MRGEQLQAKKTVPKPEGGCRTHAQESELVVWKACMARPRLQLLVLVLDKGWGTVAPFEGCCPI